MNVTQPLVAVPFLASRPNLALTVTVTLILTLKSGPSINLPYCQS